MVEEQAEQKTLRSEILANNIKSLMLHNKIREGELAKALDIPYNTIRRLVNGETVDPRTSTLKLIANYFGITIDSITTYCLANENYIDNSTHTISIPILSWDDIFYSHPPYFDKNLNEYTFWETIAVDKNEEISEYIYALESKKSMQPRFPMGSIFVVNPDIKPIDGDLVLVKINNTNDITLRELIIDPPYWQLKSIVKDSANIALSRKSHEILGVVALTIIRQRKQ